MVSALNFLLLFAIVGSSPELVAHRGESCDAPENTLAAFRLAWERKVPTIELDVHLTADGRTVICHDADTKRTAGSKLIIKDSTLAQLQALDVGQWKDARWKGERMPTLEESLATIPPNGRCFIEIKVGPEAVPAVVQAIKGSGKSSKQLVIISFKADTLAAAKRALPELEMFFLSSFKQDKTTGAWSPNVRELIQQAKAVDADGLGLSFEGPVDREFVRTVKDAGLRFSVWTVDDPEIARRYVEWGADFITTNRAAWMAGQLSVP